MLERWIIAALAAPVLAVVAASGYVGMTTDPVNPDHAEVLCPERWGGMIKQAKQLEFWEVDRVWKILYAGAYAGAYRDMENRCLGSSLGVTPLHFAAGFSENPAVVRMLLDVGARVNIRTTYKTRLSYEDSERTPLQWAMDYSQNPAVVKTLLDAGANPNSTAKGLRSGLTPLHEAAESGHAGIVGMLLEAGAEADAKRSHGTTPLHQAVDYGHAAIVSVLLEAGADPNAPQNDGVTPLHQAVSCDRGVSRSQRFPGVEIAETLLAKGADPDASADGGRTPLHWASIAGHAEEARILVKAGADVKAKDEDGNTALHIMALQLKSTCCDRRGDWAVGEAESLKTAKILLEAGARVDEKSDKGETPLDLAIQKGHDALAQLLQTAGGSQGSGG